MDLDVVLVRMTSVVDVNVLVTMVSRGVSRTSSIRTAAKRRKGFISTCSMIEIGHFLHALDGILSPHT